MMSVTRDDELSFFLTHRLALDDDLDDLDEDEDDDDEESDDDDDESDEDDEDEDDDEEPEEWQVSRRHDFR